ncbi:MAG: ATP-binding protein [Candidatus Delongbacteria bacterium]|jgi:predicted AAA+ superfamily ATPase|nr:ATP-binding protein [Candidatus Delongbacteria bacterium]
MYIKRTVEQFINRVSEQFPALLITGARQVGKTTLLRHTSSEERTYITLDDPTNLSLAKNDPALFFKRFPPPVLIDEIQYAPELLPYIKILIDEKHDKGMFWLTGSQQFHLMKGISESLAGRIGIINLLGLSKHEILNKGKDYQPFLPTFEIIKNRAEINKNISLNKLYQMIWRGSLPALYESLNIEKELFYSSYIQTYIQRDVRDLTKVGDETSFLRFLKATAARTGNLLNISDLARDTDISPNTAKSWLSILETSGIIYLLQPYHTNVSKRLIKSPKLYFFDTGLCSYLTGWTSPETLESGAYSGNILETWIFIEILKSYWHNGIKENFFFYRDKDAKEIDLLILKDGKIFPFEFKKSASPKKDHIKNFKLLNKFNLPIGEGGLICLCDDYIPLNENVTAIPVELI